MSDHLDRLQKENRELRAEVQRLLDSRSRIVGIVYAMAPMTVIAQVQAVFGEETAEPTTFLAESLERWRHES